MLQRAYHKIILLSLILLAGWPTLSAAPDPTAVMRGNAKFNVVAIVLTIIFAGLAFFLIRLDKRVTRMEKEQEGRK